MNSQVTNTHADNYDEPREQHGYRIADLDNACRALGDRGAGLGLVVDSQGRAVDVVSVDLPVPYRIATTLCVCCAAEMPRAGVVGLPICPSCIPPVSA